MSDLCGEDPNLSFIYCSNLLNGTNNSNIIVNCNEVIYKCKMS